MNKVIFLILCLLAFSCKPKKESCKQGKPTNIFSGKTAGISQHSFQSKDTESLEKIRLDSIFSSDEIIDGQVQYIPIELSILQSGCETITQEFRIEFFDKISPMPRDFSASECAGTIANFFDKISQIEINAAGFKDLAVAMSKNLDKFEYGNAIKIDGGFSLQIDKMHSSSSTLVTLIFK